MYICTEWTVNDVLRNTYMPFCFGRYKKGIYRSKQKKVYVDVIDGPRCTSPTKLYSTELWPLSTLENLLCKLEKVVTCAEIFKTKQSKQI